MTAMFNNYPLGFYSARHPGQGRPRHGLHFLPLDINRSQYLFTVEEVKNADGESEKQVRLGLKYVRGLRKEVGEAIVAERDSSGSPPYAVAGDPAQHWHVLCARTRGGRRSGRTGWFSPPPYTSVEDLVRRVPLINKREIRALSMAGALTLITPFTAARHSGNRNSPSNRQGDLFDSSQWPARQ
jgi:error-prone DNA polymerase